MCGYTYTVCQEPSRPGTLDWGERRGFIRRPGRPGKSRLAGFISEGVLAEVKRSADIVDIVSRYVALKKSGRSFKGLCPFHTEKTPSFIVNPERQTFRCFGCGKSGDVFSFVAEHERVEFPEAVRIVASAVGVSVPDARGNGGGASKELKTRLYELHAWAARFFVHQLADETAGGRARDYLAARHFEKETLEAWSLGFALDSWEALGKAARKAGFTDRELLAAGLVIAREGSQGYYDRFRNRVVFPIRDNQGRVIAFGARTLADSEVKYLNSPETPLFSKGRCLFGLDRARDAIIEEKRVIVTEGYTDTMMCHQKGIPIAVATLGTALTHEHIGVLRRYADTVVLLFDADAAGEKAVDRSLEVLADAEIGAQVATTAEGTDPCDYLIEAGPEAFRERLNAARDLFAVKLELASAKHDIATSDGRAKAIDEVLQIVGLVSNPARADLMLLAVASHMKVDLDAVRRRLTAFRKAPRKSGPDEAKVAAPELDPVERGILSAVLASNELVPCVLAKASLEDFQDARVRRIFEQCVALYDREGVIDHSELIATLQDKELSGIVADISSSAPERGNWEKWLQDCLDRLEDRKRREELRRLKEQPVASADSAEKLAAIQEQIRRRAGRSARAADDPAK